MSPSMHQQRLEAATKRVSGREPKGFGHITVCSIRTSSSNSTAHQSHMQHDQKVCASLMLLHTLREPCHAPGRAALRATR